MLEVVKGLLFGGEEVCTHDRSGAVAVVHACKDPCHRRAVGYSGRSLPSSHSNYLVKEIDYHLYLNLVDPPKPLFMMPSFTSFMAFMDKHYGARQVLIHCNRGESRAPTLALLYLAKRTDLIPRDSYPSAARAFRENIFSGYQPGLGIQTWLTQHWLEIT